MSTAAIHALFAHIHYRSGGSVWCAISYRGADNAINPLCPKVMLSSRSGAPLRFNQTRT